MKYKVGDRVRVKSLCWYEKNKDMFGNVPLGQFSFNSCNTHLCGAILTIKKVQRGYYLVEENSAYWTDEMIEGLVEEEVFIKANDIYNEEYSKGEYCHEQSFKWGFQEGYNYSHETDKLEISLKEGYIFKDENGNIINAQKIVLEKKKIVNLTQEQINTMVHDSCVLFCKHCGCGIPRDTCTSLGTCKEHDEYRDAIRVHLMENHKN